MPPNLNENSLAEQPLLMWLRELGYELAYGPDIAPGAALAERDLYRDVLLLPRLKRSLRRLNPQLPEEAINEAIRKLQTLSHPNLDIANREMYELLRRGVRVEIKKDKRARIVRIFDFAEPLNNEFLAVNQFTIQGIDAPRRPDVVVFVNGMPIAIFELKSPTSENGTLAAAYQQLQDYKKDIPDIFTFNQVLVASDLIQARHGTISSAWERFAAWKGIADENEKPNAAYSELEVLARGMFDKERIMDIMANFIVFEADSEKDAMRYTKKMCLYHQYFGVNKAIRETLRATGARGNRKIGIFWHTQGSGKSLSMVFYVNKAKLLEELESPTFVFLTDRNDLDGQLYKTFLRSGYPQAKQAESIGDLNKRLREAGGELLFTTIQKFETERELLSDRRNIIVIADEAHRSQYAKFAGNVRDALPAASFMGITGTPVSLRNRSTELVFGKYITEYKIDQAVADGATVPIYYEGRLVPLHLSNEFIDEEYDTILTGEKFDVKESFKRKWANLEKAVGSEDRLRQIADDIVEHFNHRGIEGKGMIVTISRRTAVELYRLIKAIPDAPEIAVVISNPDEFRGKIQPELNAKELEKRFKNPADPLRLVIVCDMWLTGFDVPCLHTMYIDKPLKNHSLMQAIARVNRVFHGKTGGLIVDYIGIADNLKKALSLYSGDIQKQAMVPIGIILEKMRDKYAIVQEIFAGTPAQYSGWRKLEPAALAQMFQEAVNLVITNPENGVIDEERKKIFLDESESFLRLWSFAMPHAEANKIRDEVEFFSAVKKAVWKMIAVDGVAAAPQMAAGEMGSAVEAAIRELLNKSIAAEGVIDVLGLRNGKGDSNGGSNGKQPDISIFNDKFFDDVKKMRLKNLAIETLRKLLNDQLRSRSRMNLARYQTLTELLQKIIEDYENNIINSSKVIEKLIDLAKEIRTAEDAGKQLGLSEEEMAFYDAIAASKKSVLKNGDLKQFVKELVSIIRRDLTIDWTDNEVIKAKIRANVRLLLMRNRIPVEESESLVDAIFRQASSLYRDFAGIETT